MICESYLAFTVLVSALGLLEGQPEKVEGPPSKPARSGGVAIEFAERKVLEADRTPEGEAKAILASTAVLKTERPIRYRSTVLPPGSYPVTVAAGEENGVGRNLYFLIGPAPAAEQDLPAPPEKKVEEKKVEEKRPTEGRDGPARGKKRRAESGEPKAEDGNPKAGGRPSSERAAESRAPAPSPPSRIKAIFHLSPAARPGESVQFSVRPTARGDRFSLVVRAGSSQGKATLRFAD